MINVTLVCAGGMSTSMLMNKMKQAAKDKGIELSIKAMAEGKFKDNTQGVDVVLLGPQVGYLYDQYVAKYEPKGIKVAVVDMMDYGMMNGEKVLADTITLLDNQ